MRSLRDPLGAPPEELLLLSCARVHLTAGDRARVADLIAQGVDWSRVLRLAAMHRLSAFLFRHLSAVGSGAVPSFVLGRLREEAGAIARASLTKVAQLIEALDLFDSHGIPALPFKGPLVAVDLYGDVGLRSFKDLDIAVPGRYVTAACDLLASRGYSPLYPVSLRQRRLLFGPMRQIGLIRSHDGGYIELHWQFAPRETAFRLDPDEALRRAHRLVVAGRPIPTLAREDLMVVLCMHGAKHAWEDLEQVCSVAELARGDGLCWDAVLRRADETTSRRRLLLGLRIARDLLRAPLPAEIARAVDADRTVEALATWVQARLFREPAPRGAVGETLRVQRYHVRCLDRLVDRLRYPYYWGMVPKPAELSTVRLPDWLLPLYHVLRPLRLAGKYALRATGRGTDHFP